MSAHPYVLLATYPGSPNVHLIKGANGRHIAADLENVTTLRALAQKLLAENVISSAQIFRADSEIMYSAEMEKTL
jgi:hypothetical protein